MGPVRQATNQTAPRKRCPDAGVVLAFRAPKTHVNLTVRRRREATEALL